jgi:hemerythrin-like domain-containing protein
MASGPDQSVVSALMFQHEAGRAYGKKMRGQLGRLQQGDPAAGAALAADARGYTELIREHIRIEDEYFYKLADQVLTEAEQVAIVEKFSGSPGHLAAQPERDRYLKMLGVYSGVVAGWKA